MSKRRQAPGGAPWLSERPSVPYLRAAARLRARTQQRLAEEQRTLPRRQQVLLIEIGEALDGQPPPEVLASALAAYDHHVNP